MGSFVLIARVILNRCDRLSERTVRDACCSGDITLALKCTPRDKGTGKRKFGQDEPQQLSGRNLRPQGAVDRFGAIHVLSSDKFGALDDINSTGSCTPDFESDIPSGKHSQDTPFPTWGTNCSHDSDNQATSCSSSYDLSSHSNSTPISCTLHEGTSSRRGDLPLLKLPCPPQAQHQNVHETHGTSDRAAACKELQMRPVRVAEGSQNAQNVYPGRFNYRFASLGLEASLLDRMEARQKVQDKTRKEEWYCSHVISPEDLVWGSMKHYCGMVLDRETSQLLGTAVLFVPREPPAQQVGAAGPALRSSMATQEPPKSAWVTCVQAVEGRTEVLIKNSRGSLHIAQLLLTSDALGLALFSVTVWQGTFALAFLSRVTGPAVLPHRLFVDVTRGDRVYVIGYESATIADARVRPGRIVDAGRHTIVEIDFTMGRLGGAVASPAGFHGGLVVRADGLLAGVVTGQVLPCHPTHVDFASASDVYALLEEL